MENLADRFARLVTIARGADTFLLGYDKYTGPIRPAGIVRQTSNNSRPIPKRKDGGLSQDYFVLADKVPLKFTLGDSVDGSEPYPTGVVLAPLNDNGDFLDWISQTKTLGSLQAIFWCSDGSIEAACAEESGRNFTWEVLFKGVSEQPRTERRRAEPFDADEYRKNGWKTAVEKQYTYYERLGLNALQHITGAEVGAAHRARANWWRQRGAQAQGGKNNPLIAELVPFIKTAEENLQQAFSVLSDVDQKAAYDRQIESAGNKVAEEKFLEFIRFTLRDKILTPSEKNDLLDQARDLRVTRERANELIRDEMLRTGSREGDDTAVTTPRDTTTPVVTGADLPHLSLSQTAFSLGTLRKGQHRVQSFTLDNTGGGVLQGSIDVSHPEWMTVSQRDIDPRRHHQQVTISIDTSRLTLGDKYVGMVEVRSNGGRQGVRIDFSIELQDEALSRFRKQAFWFGFLGGAVFGLLLYAVVPDAPTANIMARIAGNLAVIAFVVVGAMAGKWGGGIGAFFFAGFSEEILRNVSMPAYSAGAWAVLASSFLYIFARRLLVANLAGDRRTRTWIAAGGGVVATVVILTGLGFALRTRPQPAIQRPDDASRSLATSLVGRWRGRVGNSPATLDITQQGTTQSLVGKFSYQGVIEEVSITIKNDGNVFQLVLAGRSYRRINGTGSFALDTFSGPLSGDGLSISGAYVDSAGHQGRWSVKKVQRSISSPPAITPEGTETKSNNSTSGRSSQWIELKLGDRKGDFSLDTDHHMYYRNVALRGFAIPAESDGAWVSPVSPNQDVLCFSLTKNAQGFLIHLPALTGTMVLDGSRFAFGLSAVQWTSWSPDGTFGLAAHYYEAHPELFVITTREQTARRVPGISLAKENEEQVFDLDSVHWDSPEEFRMRATINCNPYTADTCTDATRKKVLRTYDLVVNARSLDVSPSLAEHDKVTAQAQKTGGELTYLNRDCDGTEDGQPGSNYKDLSQQNISRFTIDLRPGCFSGYILLPESWEYYHMGATGTTQNWWLAYKWYESKNSGSGQNGPWQPSQLENARHGSHKIRVQGNGQLVFYPIP